MSTLSDKRQSLYRDIFPMGMSIEDYISTGNESQQERWHEYMPRISLTDCQKELIASFTRVMNVLVVSGVWCGDCMRQGPMLAAISKENKNINLSFFENSKHEELRDEVRLLGGTRVPVVIICSEDFFEVTRFGDRTRSAYRRKAERELGPACDAGLVPPSDSELQAEVGEWLDIFERAQLMLRLSPSLRKKHND